MHYKHCIQSVLPLGTSYAGAKSGAPSYMQPGQQCPKAAHQPKTSLCLREERDKAFRALSADKLYIETRCWKLNKAQANVEVAGAVQEVWTPVITIILHDWFLLNRLGKQF